MANIQKLLRKMLDKCNYLFTKEEIRATKQLLSNKKQVYSNYYIELTN